VGTGKEAQQAIIVILMVLASRMVMFRARKCDCDGASEVVSYNLRICLAEEDPITNKHPSVSSLSSQQEDDDESPIGISFWYDSKKTTRNVPKRQTAR
jgi:hypothetical protein